MWIDEKCINSCLRSSEKISFQLPDARTCQFHMHNLMIPTEFWMLDPYSEGIWWLCYVVGGILLAWFGSTCPTVKGHCKWMQSSKWHFYLDEIGLFHPQSMRRHWMVRVLKWSQSPYLEVTDCRINNKEHWSCSGSTWRLNISFNFNLFPACIFVSAAKPCPSHRSSTLHVCFCWRTACLVSWLCRHDG